MNPLPPPPGPPKPQVKEIEIFTLEQLDVLPQDAKTSIIHLGNNLPSKELLVLNPLVTKLLKIKELTKIKYVPLPDDATPEQKEAHKASVEEFKEAKSQITALKKQNGEAKSAIKKPLDLLGSQVLTIEKSINAIALEVLTEIEKTFKPYLDAAKEKKDAAAKAKDDKANLAINTLSDANLAQANTFKKSTLTTFLKYEMLTDIKAEANNAIENYALDNLFTFRDSLKIKTFEMFSEGQDLTILSTEELTTIKTFFTADIDLLVKNINVKITALQLEETNKNLSNTVENQTEQLQAIKLPSPPLPPTFSTIMVPAAPVRMGSPISNTDVFEFMTESNGQPYGSGANQNTVKIDIYPKNHNEVDFLDLVIAQIEDCKANVEYIRKRFMEDPNIVKTEDDKANIEKVRGAKYLMDKTIDYILGKPFKEA